MKKEQENMKQLVDTILLSTTETINIENPSSDDLDKMQCQRSVLDNLCRLRAELTEGNTALSNDEIA